MTKTGYILMGAIVGAGAGYVIGSIIADHFAPEYYTEEELAEMEQFVKEYAPDEYETIERTQGGKVEKIKIVKQDKLPVAKVDYTNYYRAEKNEVDDENKTLANFAKESNRFIENRVADDVEYDVDDDYEEEDDYDEYEAIGSFLDFADLSDADPTDFIDQRDMSKPYMITEDEYADNESGYKRVLLKYYPEDDVLVSEDDRPLENAEKVVGDYALMNFGVFTMDGNVVYVSNPKLAVDYKIVNMEGSYEQMVLGATPKEVREVRNVFDESGEDDDGQGYN